MLSAPFTAVAMSLSLAATVSAAGMWSRTLDGIDREQVRAVAEGSGDDVWVAGISGDPVLPTRSWRVHLDPDGALLSERAFVATTPAIGSTVDAAIVAADGSAAFTGRIVVDDRDWYDAWILKVDPAGAIAWSTKITAPLPHGGVHFLVSLAWTSDGGVIGAGYTAVERSATPYSWVVKLAIDGTLQWQQKYDPDTSAHAIAPTGDGGYVVAGRSNVGLGLGAMWVMKLSPAGTASWQTTLGGSDQQEARDVVENAGGGYAVAGWTNSFTASGHAPWVVRLDAAGDLIWHQVFGSNEWGDFEAVTATADGGILVNGRIYDAASTTNDLWLAKLDATSGVIAWQRAYVGDSGDQGEVTVETASGQLLVGATWAAGFPQEDAWVLRLAATGELPTCSLVRDTNLVTTAPALTIVRPVVTQSPHDAVVASEVFVLEQASPTDVVQCSVPGCPEQGNVLHAVKRNGVDVHMEFTGAPASEWRVYRDTSKLMLGRSALPPDVIVAAYEDLGAAVPVGDDYYYQVKGLCFGVPGP